MPVGLTLRYCLRGRIELLGIGRTAEGDEPHRETIAGQVTRLNYTTWKNDNLRAGQQLNETILTPSNVNSAHFGILIGQPVTDLSMLSMPSLFIYPIFYRGWNT